MSSKPPKASAPQVTPTLPFEKFWTWLQAHSNCILRAGTPEVVLFDHDDYHWHLASEDESTLLVQLVRGKDLVGELVVLPGEVAYVQAEPGEGDEVTFELVVETETAREAAYHFVLAHGYDEAEGQSPPAPSSGGSGGGRRWTH